MDCKENFCDESHMNEPSVKVEIVNQYKRPLVCIAVKQVWE